MRFIFILVHIDRRSFLFFLQQFLTSDLQQTTADFPRTQNERTLIMYNNNKNNNGNWTLKKEIQTIPNH